MVTNISNFVSLDKIVDFAKSKNIPIREVELEIDQYYAKKIRVEAPHVAEADDGQFSKILDKIRGFKPLLPFYPNELPYQVDLSRYLLQFFPQLRVEHQRGGGLAAA